MLGQVSGNNERLKAWEIASIGGLILAAVVFGVLVEVRAAFLSRRMGDLGVFVRAGWAAQQGGRALYSVRCDNGWSYNYPPLLAILMVPMADPPRGQSGEGSISYETAAALWYLVNVVFLAWGLHMLASAIEESNRRRVALGSPAWWRLRLLPLFACLLPIGSTLMKGQTNLLVLCMICGFLAHLARRRSFTAGLFLAVAVCVKIFPAFLLLLPLQRKDVRCLAGCVAGLFVGLLLIPLVAFGPRQTVECYRELARVTLGPGLGVGEDTSRAAELMNVTATDNHNLRSLLHNALHLDRLTRPRTVSPLVGKLHWVLGGAMTLLTLFAFRRRPVEETHSTLLFGGSLIVVMLMICPVTHLHYFCFLVPLTMILAHVLGGDRVVWNRATLFLPSVVFGTVLLEQLPGLWVCRDLCLAAYPAVFLWAVACRSGTWRYRDKYLSNGFAGSRIANYS